MNGQAHESRHHATGRVTRSATEVRGLQRKSHKVEMGTCPKKAYDLSGRKRGVFLKKEIFFKKKVSFSLIKTREPLRQPPRTECVRL